ncbi:hypothetical protein RvY_02963 [Ramazzottius varieornatus]|uniref:Tudor domain-containing protein n=1 Tax=Ramazzottius varieornatus TaxID=947166 RepID=A0A1D1US61_RAMVA|nr:hypothetical protein RvY_02963 [Ramazzottius varieornatus]
MSHREKGNNPTKATRRPSDYKTSDPESSTPIPDYFKAVVNRTREESYWVLFQYDDGVYYLLPPSEITLDIVKPLFREINSFKEKEILQQGMKVRLFYTHVYPVSKATVIGVSKDQDRMNASFDTLDKAAKEQKKKRKRPDRKPAPTSRMTHANRTEDNKTKRKKLNDGRLGKVASPEVSEREADSTGDDSAPGPITHLNWKSSSQLCTGSTKLRSSDTLFSSGDEELGTKFPSTQKPHQRSEDSASRKSGSPLHIKACNAEEKDPDEIFNEVDLSDSGYHPSTDQTRFTDSEDWDSVSISGTAKYGGENSGGKNGDTTKDYTAEQIEEFVRKREELLKEAEIPAINWSFNADPATVDRTLFQRLQPKSPIWVRQARLQ